MKLKLQLFLTALLIISVTNVVGQISFDSPEQLEKAANEAFDAKEYEKAKPLFSQLLSLNALNPNYNYRFGVCMLYTEADPLKPLPYIEGGASTNGVNPEAYYFLGKAYQLNYRFDDAISFYEKGKKSGFSAEGVDLNKSIEECRNGKLLFNSGVEFDPAQDKEVIEAEFYRPYDFRKLKGKVIPMPPNFKTKYDEKNLRGTFVYTPSNSQILFFASYGEDGSNAKDLYRVNRLPNGEWALPQRLPDVINTKYDEDFAFFDDETQTLYFASKGHNTMGGYDVFRSVHDAGKNEWSQPINLQFPINSPYDDFLYVSDPEGKVAFFTSKRETEIGKIRVFKTLLHDPSQVELSIVEGTYEDKTDSIYNYMMASVIDPKTNQIIGKYRSNKETGKYVLILPPQNDYVMDVGPRESAGFKFDLDVPQHEPTKPLEQNLTYDNRTGEGTVTLTNFFDAAGNPDSVAVVKNRPKEEVELAMVDMPDPSELLASREAEKEKLKAQKAVELAKQEEMKKAKAAAEKAKQDSLLAAKQAVLEAEAARLKAETAKKDSIAKAEALVLQQARDKARQDSLLAEAEKAKQAQIAQEAQLAQEKARQKVVADSLSKVDELALIEAAERELELADSLKRVEAEQKEKQLAFERQKAVADSISEVEKRAVFAKAEREKFVADSIAEAENLAAKIAKEEAKVDSLEAVAEKVKADSLAAIEAEKARLAAIEREVEEAKARALRDSVVEKDIAISEQVQDQAFDDILKEMQEKEAEILAQNQTEQNPADSEKVASDETLETSEMISEADLFLQTIADLEAQKKKQEAEIAAENQRMAQDKAAKAQKAQAARDSTSAMVSGQVVVAGDSSSLATEPIEIEGEIDLEQESLALKSDADPNDYLKAIADIEAEMAKDNASNSKTYELQDLSGKEVDPVLEAKIAEDRKALEKHRQVAAEKEAALREQMQRDREVVNNVISEEEDELSAIEAELLEGIEKREDTKQVDSEEQIDIIAEADDLLEQSKEVAERKSEVEQLSAEQAKENTADSVAELQEEVKTEVEESESAALMKGSDGSVEETMPDDELVAVAEDEFEVISIEPEEMKDSGKEEVVEQVNKENDDQPVAEADDIMEEILQAENATEEVNQVSEQPATEKADVVSETVHKEIVEEAAVIDAEVGRIPFMTPALRDYRKRKADFSGIEDKTMKRMVQRMRAEDIGRMAVLKNMKNQWVDAGKTQQALKEIKENVRNQDVLATVAERPSREAKLREPFDMNDLRVRQDLFYKLDFKLTSAQVSETVQEAMDPEKSMSFFMPEFQLSSGYFKTMADADSELRYYRNLGFEAIRVVAFHKGQQIELSDVIDIPFVD